MQEKNPHRDEGKERKGGRGKAGVKRSLVIGGQAMSLGHGDARVDCRGTWLSTKAISSFE